MEGGRVAEGASPGQARAQASCDAIETEHLGPHDPGLATLAGWERTRADLRPRSGRREPSPSNS